MASKFENRIDYVDISAYGIGKVKVDQHGEGENNEDYEREIEEQTINKQSTQHARMFEKIQNFEKNAKNICYSLVSMAERQDERIEIALG
jgi:hypothetical protein